MRKEVSIIAASCRSDAAEAVAELLAHMPAELVARVGLVIGTTRGCLEADRLFDESRRDNARYASPAAFTRTLPSTAAAQIALAHRLTGPSLVVSAGAVSAAVALRRAAAWRRCFELPFAIAGGIEQLADSMRVGVVLLGDGGASSMTVADWQGSDLAAGEDHSLLELQRWIRDGGEVRLGAGISLQKRR
jgi:3-oxoacyl-(acyl-carrier-protein) synthase